MKIEREKAIRFGMLVTVLVIVFLSVVLGLLLRSEGKLQAGFRSPRITPTATARPSATTAQVKVTPAPTPIQVQVQRDYPPNAVDVRADGKLLYTAVNARAARKALEQYLAETAGLNLGENERLLRAGFDQTLTLEEPSGDGELLQVEEAVNTLKAFAHQPYGGPLRHRPRRDPDRDPGEPAAGGGEPDLSVHRSELLHPFLL